MTKKIMMEFDGETYEIEYLRLSKTNLSFTKSNGKNEWITHPVGEIKINIIKKE